jgi:hypothetical protein
MAIIRGKNEGLVNAEHMESERRSSCRLARKTS